MTTTSSTGNSISPSSATQQLLTSLNTGSGVDTASLVTALVAASIDPRTAALTRKADALTAQISDVSTLKSGIASFTTALTQLAQSGTVTTQPTSSNPAVLTATTLSGAKLTTLNAQITVKALATAQLASTAPVTALGAGTLTITLGRATVTNGQETGFTPATGNDGNPVAGVPVAITAGMTLGDAAAAINQAGAGVTATVVSDIDGSQRLSLRGRTGEAYGFQITADNMSLAQLTVGDPAQDAGAAATVGATAGNAQLVVDGIAVQRASNRITDLVAGVQLDLLAAQPGDGPTPVTLGTATPTANLTAAVQNFVDTYNQLQSLIATDTNAKTGSLFGDTTVAAIQRLLSGLTINPLVASTGAGAPTTLAELGVSTGRDGQLSIDPAKLTAAVSKFPASVEAMFAEGDGLVKAFKTIGSQAGNATYGLTAAYTRFALAQTDVASQRTRLQTEADAMKTRLTEQFAAMDARVAAYKNTQAFLKAQIDAWNQSDD